jgi:hypothetical protein
MKHNSSNEGPGGIMPIILFVGAVILVLSLVKWLIF